MKYTVKTENLPKSQIKITVSIDKESFENQVQKSKKKVLSEATLPGFRKGYVTEDVFVKTYGNIPFRQEASYDCAEETYGKVLIENKIQAVGRPSLNIISFNQNEEMIYEIVVDVMPNLMIGDYKSIHKNFTKEEIQETTDEEVQKVIEDIISYRTKKGENGEEIVPELNSEMIISLGIESGLRSDLEAKIKENSFMEKKSQAIQVHKNKVVEEIIKISEGEIPESFVENELLKIKDKISNDLSQMGVSFADYLKHMQKTEEEWKLAEKTNAEKSARLQIALLQIAKTENIFVKPEILQKEVEHLKMHYKDIDESRAKSYSEEVMTNSLTMEYVLTGKIPEQEEFFKIDHNHNHEH